MSSGLKAEKVKYHPAHSHQQETPGLSSVIQHSRQSCVVMGCDEDCMDIVLDTRHAEGILSIKHDVLLSSLAQPSLHALPVICRRHGPESSQKVAPKC